MAIRPTLSASRPSDSSLGAVRLVPPTNDARHLRRQQLGAHLVFDLAGHFLVALEERPNVVLTLPDAIALIGVPRPGLVDDAVRAGEVDDLTFAGDALSVHDLELSLAERRGALVLHDLHARHVAGHFLPLFDGADATDIETHGGIELQRVTTGRGLRTAEHDADLHADLVDEDDDGVRALYVARELTQGLRHEARVQANLHLAHLTFDLRLRRERSDGVDDDDVDGARAYEHVSDLERLLSRVGLRHEQVVDVHAELLGVNRVERMLRVDESRRAAITLHFRNHLQGERGLTGRLRTIDLDDPPLRQTAYAQRDIEAQRAGGNRFHVVGRRGIAEAHHGALAELLFDLAQCGAQSLFVVLFHLVGSRQCR